MVGKQVYEVPPTNVGGSVSCIAVSTRGMDTQKVNLTDFDEIFVHTSFALVTFILVCFFPL